MDLFSELIVSNSTTATDETISDEETQQASRPDSAGQDNVELERSVLDPCFNPIPDAELMDQPCSHFFQQRGAIDFKSYLRLKREEKEATEKFFAACSIQAAWRGFLIRKNMEIVRGAITKIQAGVKGYIARKKYHEQVARVAAENLARLRENAATKIQAAWRGYYSRTTRFNYYRFKSVQLKNAALLKYISSQKNQLRDVEDSSSSGTDDSEGGKVGSYTVIPCGSGKGSIRSETAVVRKSEMETGNLQSGPSSPQVEESLLMSRQELQKKHHLLRTHQCPGIYSDIYTTELTEIEKQLRKLKFWKGGLSAERMRKSEEETLAAKNQRLRELFNHALRISGRDIISGNNGTADDEEEFDEEDMNAASKKYKEYCGEVHAEDNNSDGDSNNPQRGNKKKWCDYPAPPTEPGPPPPTPNVLDVPNTNLTSSSPSD